MDLDGLGLYEADLKIIDHCMTWAYRLSASATDNRDYTYTTTMTQTVTIAVEVPSEALACSDEAPQQVSKHLCLLWLLEQVRTGHLSTGKAAELLDLSTSEFMATMASHGIPHPNYSVDDLRREVGLAG